MRAPNNRQASLIGLFSKSNFSAFSSDGGFSIYGLYKCLRRPAISFRKKEIGTEIQNSRFARFFISIFWPSSDQSPSKTACANGQTSVSLQDTHLPP